MENEEETEKMYQRYLTISYGLASIAKGLGIVSGVVAQVSDKHDDTLIFPALAIYAVGSIWEKKVDRVVLKVGLEKILLETVRAPPQKAYQSNTNISPKGS